MDPCLDDCIMFAKKLKSLGKSVSLDILEGLPHGFLSFVKVCSTSHFVSRSISEIGHVFFVLQLSKEANEGNRVCITRLAELLEADVPPEESTC